MSTKELLFSITKKDFKVDTFRCGGKGGQNQNKVESGARITHLENEIILDPFMGSGTTAIVVKNKIKILSVLN